MSLDEIENIEIERDAKWVELMSLYVSDVAEVFKQKDVTLEMLIDAFVNGIKEQSKRQGNQLWGRVEVNLP